MTGTTKSGWDAGRSAVRRVRAESMLRRTLRIVWVAGLVPFGAVAISLLTQPPQAILLREAAMTRFAAPLGGVEVAVDRAGTHVALVTGSADVEILKLERDALSTQTVDVPWSFSKAGGTVLQWVDVDRDELADLRVTPMIDEALMTQLAEGKEIEYSVPCFDYVQTATGFKASKQPADRLELQDQRFAGQAYVEGQTFELSVEDGWRQRTQLVGDRGGRQMLTGTALQVADLNGDGRDEILTSEEACDEYPMRLTYRVYTHLDNRFQIVWQYETLVATDDLSYLSGAMRSVVLADLDGDGSAEVICGEASTGEVRVLRWHEPSLN